MAAKNSVVDIEAIIKQWALQMFKITRNKEQARIPVDDLLFNVNWKKIKITHKSPDYEEKTKPPEPKSQVLFKTSFRNNTEHEQEYSFKTERSTRSSCEVQIEKGVSYGEELGLSLTLPGDVLEVGCGFSRELSVTNTVQESFEQELTWGVDSQVKVPPKHKTTASLMINEDEYNGTFTVKTKLSGKITVSITNTRDNNAFVKSIEGDIAEIIKKEVYDNGLQGVNVEKNVVTYVTKGKCFLRFGVEQHVSINEEPL